MSEAGVNLRWERVHRVAWGWPGKGIRSLVADLSMSIWVESYPSEIEIEIACRVVVVGGGPAGVAAAHV
jgi:NADPH-dependent 2,4-dienoyl-CoA reductase/sulfur reductase-like enzyme